MNIPIVWTDVHNMQFCVVIESLLELVPVHVKKLSLLLNPSQNFVDGKAGRLMSAEDFSDVFHDLSRLVLLLLTLLLLADLGCLSGFSPQGSEGIVHQAKSFIDISLFDFLPEVELGKSLGQSDDSKKSSGRDVHVAMVTVLIIFLKFPLLDVLGNNVVVETSRDCGVVLLSCSDEGSHDI